MDIQRMTHGRVAQTYLANVETGRTRIIYPEYANDLTRVLGMPGWVLLEAMGYRTDATGSRAYPVDVVDLYEALTDDGKRAAKQLMRALPVLSCGSSTPF